MGAPELPTAARPQPSILGARRTYQNIEHFEKVVALLVLLDLTINLGFMLFRLSTLDVFSPDFTLALLVVINIVFCYFYLFHGILYEQPHEIAVLVISTVTILAYTVINFVGTPNHKIDMIKKARLVFTVIFSPLVAVCGMRMTVRYFESGNLVFRLVGGDPHKQSMCRKLQRATVLNVFDVQLLLSCLVLIIRDSHESYEKYIQYSVVFGGLVLTLAWFIIGFIGMHKEKSIFIWIYLISWSVSPGYVIWQIITTSGLWVGADDMLSVAVYISGALFLAIHLYLLVNTIQVYKNFGKGLLEHGV